MIDIFLFELKKIVRRRTTICSVVAVSMFIIIISISSVFEYKAYDKQGNAYTGLQAIEVSKSNFREESSKLTEENITKDLKYFKQNSEVSSDGKVSFQEDKRWSFFIPKQNYFLLIANNYSEPFIYSDVNKINTIDLSNGANFYQNREEKLKSILNNTSYGNYSNSEKIFWSNMNKKIEEPYNYGYNLGWTNILDRLSLFIFIILAICISVSPVFASEYQSGADAIILSSKYGKSKVIFAKILAAYTFSIVTYLVIAILGIGTMLVFFGTEGWNLPIQIINTIIPYPFTCLELVLYILGINFVVIISLTTVTLFLSAKLKSPFSVLIINIGMIIMPLFIPEGNKGSLYNHITYLLPGQALQNLYSQYISYSIGNIVVDVYIMNILIYGIFILIFLPLTMRVFKNHQIA